MALSECLAEVNSQGRELVLHGTTGFPIASYADDITTEAVPWHWHDELEAIVVTEGTAVLSAGSQKYTVEAGNGLFINAGALHAGWNKKIGDCKAHSVVFHPRLVAGSPGSVYWENYINPLLADSSLKGILLQEDVIWQKQAMDHMEAAWQNCVQELPGFEFVVREELSKMLYLICSNRTLVEEVPPSPKAVRDGARIKLMMHFVQSHFAEEITIAEIAKSASISVSECLRCFRATIGVSPIQYLKQLRIQMACELLVGTEEKVAEIGAECGFSDMSYFSKIFKEEKGCTPSDYRQKQ